MARRLEVTHYHAEVVLVPPREKPVEALRITVFGPNFPQRAVEPEIFVGDVRARDVTIARDQRSVRGFYTGVPPEGGVVRVVYGDSQEGTAREPFSRAVVRPLPERC